MYFGVIAPGTVGDQVAYEDTGLSNVIESFPPGIFIVADAAYTLTEHMIVPLTGSNHLHKEKDAFNYFLSQLCIQIEMAFGLLMTKWPIRCHKLECLLKQNIDIIHACAILHNYVITNDYYDDFDEEDLALDGPHIAAMEDSRLGWGYIPTVEPFHVDPGSAHMRDAIIRHIERHGHCCPHHNVQHQQQEQELYDINLM
jgi:hypothetical protein